MRARARVLALVAALTAGCSLFVDLDGLSNGAGPAVCDGAACVSVDAATEGAAIDSGPGPDGSAIVYTYGDISDLANWERFDLDGYVLDDAGDFPSFTGGSSDGRYVYFTPFQVGYTSALTGLVLRYDTTKSFSDGASWTSFDVKAAIDANAAGFGGQGFDGRYLYLTPGYTTLTVRYDTTADFASPMSWSKIDLGPLGSNIASALAVPVGKYVYYAPIYDFMLRYDTTLPFEQASSWIGVDQVNVASASTYDFGGAIFDGANIVMFPNSNAPPSEALRYDTTQQLAATGAWSKLDLATLDGGTVPSFEQGAVFDGRYAYATPHPQGTTSVVERYETAQPFTSSASWSQFDLTAQLGIANDDAFGAFDGRYLYVVGYLGAPLVRFDTQAAFEDKASWTQFSLVGLPGDATSGFGGTAFDGQYVYFVPRGSGAFYRFHARTPSK